MIKGSVLVVGPIGGHPFVFNVMFKKYLIIEGLLCCLQRDVCVR